MAVIDTRAHSRGNVIYFDGDTTGLDSGLIYSDILGPDESFSISMWVNPITFSTYDTLVAATSDNTWNDGFGMYVESVNRIRWWINNYGSLGLGQYFQVTVPEYNDPRGFYAGYRWNGTTEVLTGFINGINVGDATPEGATGISATATSSTIWLGEAPSDYSYEGYMDDIVFYNRAIPDSAFLALTKQNAFARHRVFSVDSISASTASTGLTTLRRKL